MSNLVATLSNEFGSFQATWSQLAQEDPALQTALEEWALSTDGQFQFLENNTTNASPAGTSAPTIDPAGTYSGPGASAPTLAAAGTYIPVTGATSSAAEKFDPAGTYSPAGASAATHRSGRHVQRRTGPARPRWRRRARIFRARGRPPRRRRWSTLPALTAGGRERADRSPCRHVSATTGASATTACRGGHVYSWHGGDLHRGGGNSILPALTVSRARARLRLRSRAIMLRQPAPAARRRSRPAITSRTRARRARSWRSRWPFRARSPGQTIAPLENDHAVFLGQDFRSEHRCDGHPYDRTVGRRRPIVRRRGFRRAHDQRVWRLPPHRDRGCDHRELDALIFTPSASTTPTTFTLTDTSTAGTSANDANTTVTVESHAGRRLRGDVSRREVDARRDPGGFDILDTAAAITATSTSSTIRTSIRSMSWTAARSALRFSN